MLKGIDPILNADLLWALRAMGHGDDIVLADSNFPAATMGKRVIRMDGVSGPRLLDAVLSVLPIDDFVPDPAVRIEVVDDPEAEPEVCREYAAILARPSMAPCGSAGSSASPSTSGRGRLSPWSHAARSASTAASS
jgi:L-fucose mutarotase